MLDYGSLPPEINSGRMYAGPVSGSMLAAAAAWDERAADLYATAANVASVISELTSGPWLGASSAAMASAAAPYSAWLNATAAQAEQTGAQAKAAAAAHATAVAMTVPPAVIAANRAQWATLIATNIFGQNAPAIAANEAHYAEMWAQDAAAMHGYAAASQTASQVTPFTSPQQTTNPNGLAAQSAAATQVAGTSAGHAMSTPSTSIANLGNLSDFLALPEEFFNDFAIIGSVLGGDGGAYGFAGAQLASATAGTDLGLAMAPATLAEAPVAASSLASAVQPLEGASVSAGVGRASSVSGLSVPQAWATAAPELRLAAAELPAPSFVPAAGAGGMFGSTPLVGGAPLMSLAGRGGADSRTGKSPDEEKRKAAKGRRSTMR
jgi:PPE-repeat protein